MSKKKKQHHKKAKVNKARRTATNLAALSPDGLASPTPLTTGEHESLSDDLSTGEHESFAEELSTGEHEPFDEELKTGEHEPLDEELKTGEHEPLDEEPKTDEHGSPGEEPQPQPVETPAESKTEPVTAEAESPPISPEAASAEISEQRSEFAAPVENEARTETAESADKPTEEKDSVSARPMTKTFLESDVLVLDEDEAEDEENQTEEPKTEEKTIEPETKVESEPNLEPQLVDQPKTDSQPQLDITAAPPTPKIAAINPLPSAAPEVAKSDSKATEEEITTIRSTRDLLLSSKLRNSAIIPQAKQTSVTPEPETPELRTEKPGANRADTDDGWKPVEFGSGSFSSKSPEKVRQADALAKPDAAAPQDSPSKSDWFAQTDAAAKSEPSLAQPDAVATGDTTFTQLDALRTPDSSFRQPGAFAKPDTSLAPAADELPPPDTSGDDWFERARRKNQARLTSSSSKEADDLPEAVESFSAEPSEPTQTKLDLLIEQKIEESSKQDQQNEEAPVEPVKQESIPTWEQVVASWSDGSGSALPESPSQAETANDTAPGQKTSQALRRETEERLARTADLFKAIKDKSAPYSTPTKSESTDSSQSFELSPSSSSLTPMPTPASTASSSPIPTPTPEPVASTTPTAESVSPPPPRATPPATPAPSPFIDKAPHQIYDRASSGAERPSVGPSDTPAATRTSRFKNTLAKLEALNAELINQKAGITESSDQLSAIFTPGNPQSLRNDLPFEHPAQPAAPGSSPQTVADAPPKDLLADNDFPQPDDSVGESERERPAAKERPDFMSFKSPFASLLESRALPPESQSVLEQTSAAPPATPDAPAKSVESAGQPEPEFAPGPAPEPGPTAADPLTKFANQQQPARNDSGFSQMGASTSVDTPAFLDRKHILAPSVEESKATALPVAAKAETPPAPAPVAPVVDDWKSVGDAFQPPSPIIPAADAHPAGSSEAPPQSEGTPSKPKLGQTFDPLSGNMDVAPPAFNRTSSRSSALAKQQQQPISSGQDIEYFEKELIVQPPRQELLEKISKLASELQDYQMDDPEPTAKAASPVVGKSATAPAQQPTVAPGKIPISDHSGKFSKLTSTPTISEPARKDPPKPSKGSSSAPPKGPAGQDGSAAPAPEKDWKPMKGEEVKQKKEDKKGLDLHKAIDKLKSLKKETPANLVQSEGEKQYSFAKELASLASNAEASWGNQAQDHQVALRRLKKKSQGAGVETFVIISVICAALALATDKFLAPLDRAMVVDTGNHVYDAAVYMFPTVAWPNFMANLAKADGNTAVAPVSNKKGTDKKARSSSGPTKGWKSNPVMWFIVPVQAYFATLLQPFTVVMRAKSAFIPTLILVLSLYGAVIISAIVAFLRLRKQSPSAYYDVLVAIFGVAILMVVMSILPYAIISFSSFLGSMFFKDVVTFKFFSAIAYILCIVVLAKRAFYPSAAKPKSSRGR